MKKISIKLGNADKDIYITQTAGYMADCSSFHKHSYVEVHFVYQGSVRFLVDGKEYVATAGEMIALPANVYHERLSSPAHTRWSVFQIDVSIPTVMIRRFPSALTAECQRAAEVAAEEGTFGDFALILSLLVSRFFDNEGVKAEPVRDDAFLINEFLISYYDQDPKLSDLAAQLFVSEKQAERLVKKYTGTTFKKALTAMRGTVAEYLVRHYRLPLREVAKLVGYKSYNGFWKAHIKDTKEP